MGETTNPKTNQRYAKCWTKEKVRKNINRERKKYSKILICA